MRWFFLHFQSSQGYCSEGRGRGAGIPDRHASRNGFWRCLFCEIKNAPVFFLCGLLASGHLVVSSPPLFIVTTSALLTLKTKVYG